MTTISNNMSNPFTFRNKFRRIITDENLPAIVAAFKEFCSLDPKTPDALNFLWQLTYSSNWAIQFLYSVGLNLNIIPASELIKFRNELRYQYEIRNPGYFTKDIPEECMPAFNWLADKTDLIVASAAYNTIISYPYTHWCDVNRICYLIRSDKENFSLGGLHEIGFTYEESKFLQPYTMQILNLLEAVYDYNQNHVSATSAESSVETRAESSNEAHDEVPAESSDKTQALEAQAESLLEAITQSHADAAVESLIETQNEEPFEANSSFKPLTTEAILEHKDVFIPFVESGDMNILLQIGKLGFDLNKVITKKKEVKRVLELNSKVDKIDELIWRAEVLKSLTQLLMIEAAEHLND